MINGEAQGKGPRGEAHEGPPDVRRGPRRLADKTKSCLNWHSDRMKNDPEYRATVHYLTKMLAQRPGRVGRTVRDMVAAHTTLGNVL